MARATVRRTFSKSQRLSTMRALELDGMHEGDPGVPGAGNSYGGRFGDLNGNALALFHIG